MSRTTRSLTLSGGAATLAAVLTLGAVAAQVPPSPSEDASPSPFRTDGLSIRGAWTDGSMMVELAGAAYMTIRNDSPFEDVLVAAFSPAARVVRIHQTVTDEDGSMVMAPISGIPLPPYSDTVLEPGGYHVMLIDLVEPLAEGESIELTLDFADAHPLRVLVPVRATGPMSEIDRRDDDDRHDGDDRDDDDDGDDDDDDRDDDDRDDDDDDGDDDDDDRDDDDDDDDD